MKSLSLIAVIGTLILNYTLIADDGAAAYVPSSNPASAVAAMRELSDSRAADMAAAIVKDTPGWRKWPVADKAFLASVLMPGDRRETHEALACMADVVHAEVIASPAALEKLPPEVAMTLLSALSNHVRNERLESWASAWRAAALKRAGSMTPAEIVSAVQALRALGDASCLDVLASWASSEGALGKASSPELAAIAWLLQGDPEAPGPLAERIASQAQSKWFSDSPATAVVSPVDLEKVCQALSGHLTAERRAQWLSSLRARSDAQVSQGGSISWAGVQSLSRAARTLGDTRADQIVVEWVNRYGVDGLTGAELAELAPLLRGADAASKAARLTVLKHVQMLSRDTVTFLAVGPNNWNIVLTTLSPDMSEETRREWAQTFVICYEPGDRELASLSPAELPGLMGTLQLLGHEDPQSVGLAYLTAPSAVAGAGGNDLAAIVGSIQGSHDKDALKALRPRLVERVNQYLADAWTVRTVRPDSWRTLVGFLSEGLSETARRQWAQALRDAFIEDEIALRSLGRYDLAGLSQALDSLGQPMADSGASAMVLRCKTWRAWPATDIVWLAASSAKDPSGQGAKTQAVLAEYLASGPLGAGIDKLPMVTVRTLLGCFKAGLPPQILTNVDRRARQVFDQAELQKSDSMAAAAEILKDIGATDLQTKIHGFVSGGKTWPDWSAKQLIWLLLAIKTDASGKDARLALLRVIESRHMDTPQHVRQAGQSFWTTAAGRLASDFAPGSRARWVEKLHEAFGPGAEGFASMPSQEIRNLHSTLKTLGDAQADNLVLEWMKASDSWRRVSGNDALVLTAETRGQDAVAKEIRLRLLEPLEQRGLDEKVLLSVNLGYLKTAATSLADDLPDESKARLVQKLRGLFTQTLVQSKSDTDLTAFMNALKALGDQETSSLLLDRLAGIADLEPLGIGKLHWMLSVLDQNSGDAQKARSRILETLQKQLQDDNAIKSLTNVQAKELIQVVRGLRADDPRMADLRARLMRQIAAAFLKDSAAVRSAGLELTFDYLGAFVKEFSEEEKAQWTRRLAETHVSDKSAMSSIAAADLWRLLDSLSLLGGDRRDVLISFVKDCPQWKAWTLSDRITLAMRLTRDSSDAAKAALSQVAAQVSRDFDDPVILASLDLRQCQDAISSMGPMFSRQTAEYLHGRLCGSLAEAAQSPLKFRGLVTYLVASGDERGLTAVKDFIAGDTFWQKWTPQEIQMLLTVLKDPAGKLTESRLRISQFLFDEYAARPEKSAAVDVKLWSAILQQVAKDSSGQTRLRWAKRLREILLAKGWESLTPSEFTATLVLLRDLGDVASPEQALRQLAQDGSWQSWSLKDLLGLVVQLWPEKGIGAAKLKQQLVEFFSRKYLSGDASARELGWAGVRTAIMGCRAALTADLSAAWAKRLISAYGGVGAIIDMPVNELKGMIDTLSQLGGHSVQEILVSKINQSDDWRRWQVADVLWLAGALKIDTSEDGQAARKRLGACIREQYLSDARAARLLAPSQLATAVACLDQEDEASRSAAARQIASAYAGSDSAVLALNGGEFRCIYQVLRDLDARLADPLVGPYLAGARGLMETPTKDLVPLFKCLWQVDAARTTQWLADIEKAQLESGASSWKAAEGFTAVWDALGDKNHARAWAKRLSESLAGEEAFLPPEALPRMTLLAKWDKQGGLEIAHKWNAAWTARNADLPFKWDVCQSIISIFTGFGEQEAGRQWALRYLSSTQRQDAEALTARVEDGLCVKLVQLSLGARLWDVSLTTVLKRVQHASAQDRPAVWRACLRQLPPERLMEADDALQKDLSALTLALDPEGGLKTSQIVSDLMQALACSPAGRMSLERQLHNALLLESAGKVSPAARQLAAEGLVKAGAGDADTALDLFAKCLNENVSQKDLADLLRRAMLPLLLEKNDARSIASAGEIVRSLLSAGADNELRNFICRLAMAKVAQAPAAEQKKAWEDSLSLLPSGPIVLLPATMEAFARMIDSLPQDSSLPPDRAAIDLMLLAPDLESLAALSMLRSRFCSQEERASRMLMGVMLMSATDAGCSQAIQKCLEAAQAGDELKAMLYWGTTPAKRPLIVDSALAKAAREAMSSQGSMSPRRKAFLLLLSGQDIAAMQAGHAALQAAQACPRQAGEAMDDLAALLAIHDGDYHSSQRFSFAACGAANVPAGADEAMQALMQCEKSLPAAATDPSTQQALAVGQLSQAQRADLIRQGLAHRRQSLVRQIAKALSSGDKTWAAAAWSLAVNQQPAQPEQSQTLKQVLEAVRPQSEPADAVEVLQTMMPHLSQPARRVAMIEAAGIQYAEGNHDQCVALLDKASELAAADEQHDVASGHMRAMSLVRLRKYEDAVKQLSQMRQWSCSPEDEAKTVYLVGWVQLQQNDVPEAIATFDALVQKHPESSFAAKAKELLEQLRSN